MFKVPKQARPITKLRSLGREVVEPGKECYRHILEIDQPGWGAFPNSKIRFRGNQSLIRGL